MILNEEDVKRILKTRPNKALVDLGQKQHADLCRHLYGKNLNAYLTKLDGVEGADLHKLRVKYAQSTKDLMARLYRPIDKIFSAKGGSSYYGLSGTADARLKKMLSNVADGYSVRSWMQHHWKSHFLDDPNGLIFMELATSTDLEKLRQAGRPVCYPTYKSINDIYEYKTSGSSVEYVFFNTTKQEKIDAGFMESENVYRMVDDAQDVYVSFKDEGAVQKTVYKQPLPNVFMKVPAMLIGDTPNPQVPGNMLPFFDDVLDIANSYLRDGSIKLTHKLLHGNPKPWQYAPECTACSGTGVNGNDPCKVCGGSGLMPVLNVSDQLVLPMPKSDDKVITPDVAGYSTPPVDFYKMATDDMNALEAAAHYVLWGVMDRATTGGMSATSDKTATEIVYNMKPMADRLEEISNVAERREKFIIDMVAMINISQSYEGSSVNYGSRFLIESPDALKKSLEDGIKAGLPHNTLYSLMREYLEAKYDNDPVTLATELKFMDVEPFPYWSIDQVKSAGITGEDLAKKLYYPMWYASLESYQRLTMTKNELSASLTVFVSGKQLQTAQPLLP